MIEYPPTANFPCPFYETATSGINNLVNTEMASGRSVVRRLNPHKTPDKYNLVFKFGVDSELMHEWRDYIKNNSDQVFNMKVDEQDKKPVIFINDELPITRSGGFYSIACQVVDYV